MPYLLPPVLALIVVGSLRVTNPEDMVAAFRQAQKLMATGDYTAAERAYEQLVRIRRQRLLRPHTVHVDIDDESVRLQEAARYQLANIERRRAKALRTAIERGGAADDSTENSIRRHLRAASRRFAALREDHGFGLRERSGYLVVECLYDAKDYAGAVTAARRQLAAFPTGEFEPRTRYLLGWALSEQGAFAEAVDSFAAFVAMAPGTIRADRARLRMGMALEALGDTARSLEVFTELAESHDPLGMSEVERRESALAALREGHSRRRIAAKAWIKRGDLLGTGNLEEAVASYRTVETGFSSEEDLAEMAWSRHGRLMVEAGSPKDGVAVYRLAGEQSSRRGFQARMHAAVMNLYFEEGRYREAAEWHRAFIEGYSDQTREAGIGIDAAQYRLAESLRLLAETTEGDTVRALREQALAAFAAVRAVPAAAAISAAALMGQADMLLALEDTTAAYEVYEEVVHRYPGTEAACFAWLAMAQTGEEPADGLYQEILANCPDEKIRATAILELARQATIRGDLVEARALLDGASGATTGRAGGYLQLADAFVLDGREHEARNLLSRMLEEQADHVHEAWYTTAQAQLGLLLQRAHKHDQAVSLLQDALISAAASERAQVWFALGWSQLQAGSMNDAWETWTGLLRSGIGDILLRRKTLRALSICGVRMSEPQRLVGLYASLERDPGLSVETQLARTRYYLDSGDGEAALQVLADIQAPTPGQALERTLLFGQALYASGRFALATQELSIGLSRLETIHSLEDSSSDMLLSSDLHAQFEHTLGSIALQTGDFVEAAWRFRRASERATTRPARAGALYYRATALLSHGARAESLILYRMLSAEYPDTDYGPRGVLALAESLYEDEKYEEAAVQYRLVWMRWPDSECVPQALYGAGWCAIEQGDQKGMELLLARLAEEFPDHTYSHAALMHVADSYYNEGEYDAAAKWYSRIVDKFPDSGAARESRLVLVQMADMQADLLYQAGMVLFNSGKYEAAIETLESVVLQFPATASEAAARCNIGVALQRLERWREAVEVLDEAARVLEARSEETAAWRFAVDNRDWVLRHISGGDS